jgi:hypothetical protein
VGQPAVIKIDAFPDRKFSGRVAELRRTPEPTSAYGANVKNYSVWVSLDDPIPSLRVGLTAIVEIDTSGSNDGSAGVRESR